MEITIFTILIALSTLRVIEIGDSNYTNILSNTHLALVEFYAENCSTCRNFKNEFEKVEGILTKENYLVGRVDIDKNIMLFDQFNIIETPTLFLLLDGKTFKYTEGAYNASSVKTWALQLPSTTYKKISDSARFNAFRQMKLIRSVVLKCFQNDTTLQFYDELAKNNMDFEFYWIDLKTIKEKNKSLTIEVYNTKPSFSGDYTLAEINSFIELYRLPLISEFNKDTERALFTKHKPVMIFFLNSDQYRKHFGEYYSCAKENFGKLIVTTYTGNQITDIS